MQRPSPSPDSLVWQDMTSTFLNQHPIFSKAMKENSRDSQTRTNKLVINLWSSIEDLSGFEVDIKMKS